MDSKKIKQGEWKSKGLSRFELDFYHDEKKIAIEYDGGVHKNDAARKRDVRKNLKCKDLDIVLYRLRDPSLSPLNDDNSIEYKLNKDCKIADGLFDCKQELETILSLCEIPFDSNDFNFSKDRDAIISEYNQTYVNYYAKERVGQVNYNPVAKQNMTIVEYHSSRDITIRFDDGAIRANVSYSDFQDGHIQHPDMLRSDHCKKRLGETNAMYNGMMATIVAYREFNDIDVMFEDGGMRFGITYGNFQIGNIKHPCDLPETKAAERIYETAIMNNGQEATIVKYRNSNDIDVIFEDGTVVCSKQYDHFQRGSITNPNFIPHLNESMVMKNGMSATVIDYRMFDDIDVQFEDGSVAHNVDYGNFQKGNVGHPNLKCKTTKNGKVLTPTRDVLALERLGESRVMKNGQNAKIIRYGKYKDIDIEFEDGTICYKESYYNFERGTIKNPNGPKARRRPDQEQASKRIQEMRTMHNGMTATIIAYRSSNDIDIQFEDGAIAYGITYSSFKRGNVSHPSVKQRLGETKIMNNGQQAKITRYDKATDMDVTFEDGTIIKARYEQFQKGTLGNPNFKRREKAT